MTKIRTAVLATAVILSFIVTPGLTRNADAARDKIEQPDKVMEATGVKPGMVIGEVGAGRGYFTFWLAKGVGESGKIYANDIDGSALAAIERRRESEKVGRHRDLVRDRGGPALPAGLARHGLHGQRLPRPGEAGRAPWRISSPPSNRARPS
ncbi:MAG: hypothetical protein MZV70_70565 [Desulfobacterales bacterium]|nr:hypothetical protein [Desulfobacterales bacterium]